MLLGMFVGLLITAVALGAFMIASRERAPRLTPEAYRAALERWEARGLKSYDMDVEILGNQPGKVHIEVRDGQVAHMTRDGVEPRQRRTWEYWTVEGQFETLARELENAEAPADAFKAPGVSEMVMWAEFDPVWGYPRRYDRVALGGDFEVHWKVTNFRPLDGKN